MNKFISKSQAPSGLFWVACTLIIIIAFMPIADFFTIYARYYGMDSLSRVSLAYRLLILLLLVFVCFFGVKNKRITLWVTFFLIEWSILISGIFIFDDTDGAIESALLLLKFFMFFLFYDYFYLILSKGWVSYAVFVRLINCLILIYSVPIIIGAVFGVEMFHYYSGDRWGVKGIIISGNEASGFLIVALAWSLLSLTNVRDSASCLIVVCAMFMCGTKATVVGLILLLCGWLWANGGLKNILLMVIYGFVGIIALMTAYTSSEFIQLEVQNTYSYFEYQFDNNAGGSWVTLALSGRDYKFMDVYSEIVNSSVWVMFVGGYPVARYSVEMDVFDFIALAGVGGLLIYAFYWYRVWADINDITREGRRFKYVFILVFFLVGFLGGHLFYSAILAPFLAALAIKFYGDQY